MIASKDSFEPHSSEQLPNSKKVFVGGKIHPDVRVPMREIEVGDTKSYTGAVEKNAPVRVYDCSGPWGDPDFTGKSDEGLPALRADWILKRGDVAEYSGREVKPMDNGYLSGKHAEFASKAEKNRLVEFPGLLGQRRKPLRASKGHPVTQLWYAKQGIITPEMEFIAIRENMKIADCESRIADLAKDNKRADLGKQHSGSSQLASSEYSPSVFKKFPQRIPKEITPEFVRAKSPPVARSFR
jgi:phosphomethylpyrimidine synthase